MKDSPFIKSIKLNNFLSFGPDSPLFELKNLNVLIGINGSGKSNLIESMSLLKSTPRDLTQPIREGGGVKEWLWKGSVEPPIAEIEVFIDNPHGKQPMALRHQISFNMVGQALELVDESIENEKKYDEKYKDVMFYYRYQKGNPVISILEETSQESQRHRKLKKEDVSTNQSILSQRRDQDLYPEITYLAQQYEKISLFRGFDFNKMRIPSKVDHPSDFLLENGENLGLVINSLYNRGLRITLLEYLKNFNDSFVDISPNIESGTIQILTHESTLKTPVSAYRISDGTLHYLCLLAILCHPQPPRLICIEEPEIGLHPDILPEIAELLVNASERCQIIVTTHSDILVDALSTHPETIIVCEKENGATILKRLNEKDLKLWLDKYSLGQLWRNGEIGGNRW